MANINLVGVAERDTHTARSGNVKVAYLVEREIDLAEVALKKGAPLASGDVVVAFRIPAQSVIQGAFVAVDEKLTTSAVTVDVATTSGTALITGATVGAAAARDIVAAASPAPVITNTSTDFVEVTLNDVVAGDVGKFRVSIEVMDLVKARRPGLAQIGS